MKIILMVAGRVLLISGFIFLFVFPFIVISDPAAGTRDILGLQIPQAPEWTSYIPIIGWLIGIIFESISLHGLVHLSITLILVIAGNTLVDLGRKRNEKV
jgi:hypothetical protein